MNGFAGTFNSQAKMPLVGLPMSVNKILDGVDASHRYPYPRDHWDETAARSIPKKLPVYVQHQADAAKIRSQGFTDVRVLNGSAVFNGVTISKTGGVHGTEAMYANPQLAEILGDAMGVVFQSNGHKTAYIMGDTVWSGRCKQSIEPLQTRLSDYEHGLRADFRHFRRHYYGDG